MIRPDERHIEIVGIDRATGVGRLNRLGPLPVQMHRQFIDRNQSGAGIPAYLSRIADVVIVAMGQHNVSGTPRSLRYIALKHRIAGQEPGQ